MPYFSFKKELLYPDFLCSTAEMIPPEDCVLILTGLSRSVDLCGTVHGCIEVQYKTLCLQTNKLA